MPGDTSESMFLDNWLNGVGKGTFTAYARVLAVNTDMLSSLSARVQVLSSFLDVVTPHLAESQRQAVCRQFRQQIEQTMDLADDARFRLTAKYHSAFLDEVNRVLTRLG